ncbi:hypothetical protein M758_6G076800 [Ceratodon purpureus]|nr:hypothetical protein M758_6G076800 [Ceratodon purpureus]
MTVLVLLFVLKACLLSSYVVHWSRVTRLQAKVIIKAVLYDLFESVRDLCRKLTISSSFPAVPKHRLYVFAL